MRNASLHIRYDYIKSKPDRRQAHTQSSIQSASLNTVSCLRFRYSYYRRPVLLKLFNLAAHSYRECTWGPAIGCGGKKTNNTRGSISMRNLSLLNGYDQIKVILLSFTIHNFLRKNNSYFHQQPKYFSNRCARPACDSSAARWLRSAGLYGASSSCCWPVVLARKFPRSCRTGSPLKSLRPTSFWRFSFVPEAATTSRWRRPARRPASVSSRRRRGWRRTSLTPKSLENRTEPTPRPASIANTAAFNVWLRILSQSPKVNSTHTNPLEMKWK